MTRKALELAESGLGFSFETLNDHDEAHPCSRCEEKTHVRSPYMSLNCEATLLTDTASYRSVLMNPGLISQYQNH